jgi:hypothetical protein
MMDRIALGLSRHNPSQKITDAGKRMQGALEIRGIFKEAKGSLLDPRLLQHVFSIEHEPKIREPGNSPDGLINTGSLPEGKEISV